MHLKNLGRDQAGQMCHPESVEAKGEKGGRGPGPSGLRSSATSMIPSTSMNRTVSSSAARSGGNGQWHSAMHLDWPTTVAASLSVDRAVAAACWPLALSRCPSSPPLSSRLVSSRLVPLAPCLRACMHACMRGHLCNARSWTAG
jgi:hypothetical protein